MAAIEANVTINLPDNIDPREYATVIEQILTELNGLPTHINVIEVDDLISLSPIYGLK